MSSWLKRLSYLLPCLAVSSACERRGWELSDSVPIQDRGATFANGGSLSGGAGSSGTAGGQALDMCVLDSTKSGSAIFASQAVNFMLPARKELYALVNDADARALRAGAPLVPASIAGPAQSGLAGVLRSLTVSSSEQRRQLAETLSQRFKSVRSTWPNPWALRLVDHPGSEHMNVLRIVLRDDALIVRIAQGSPAVVDVNNVAVAIEVANAQPQRIAAIYYQLDSAEPSAPSADRCETGMREIALGNETMVEEWSLGTSEISKRLEGDIELLQALFEVSRRCTNVERGSTFRSFTVCQTWPTFSPSTEYSAYQWALSTPVESYKPTPQNLASLIQALQDDFFEEDPFFVRPELPVLGGAGGEGGASPGGEASTDAGAGGMGGVP